MAALDKSGILALMSVATMTEVATFHSTFLRTGARGKGVD